ncbi:hypothetical protein AB2N08_15705 [Massilia aurea]
MIETFVRAAHRRPAWKKIKAIVPKPAWVAYFIYAPDGVLSSAHRFTLARLKDTGFPLLVVCACPDAQRLPADLPGYCDALLWKDLIGHDFSAYTLALRQICKYSPGANVIVQNDSVFGPFTDLRTISEHSRWDLTGFTASSQMTNHIQSYAFCLKHVDRVKMAHLSPIFFPVFALSDPQAVVYLQEIRMARVAARSMKVGALWFSDVKQVLDSTLVRPMELLDTGFPYLKRSLVTKHKSYMERDRVLERLERFGHPLDV